MKTKTRFLLFFHFLSISLFGSNPDAWRIGIDLTIKKDFYSMHQTQNAFTNYSGPILGLNVGKFGINIERKLSTKLSLESGFVISNYSSGLLFNRDLESPIIVASYNEIKDFEVPIKLYYSLYSKKKTSIKLLLGSSIGKNRDLSLNTRTEPGAFGSTKRINSNMDTVRYEHQVYHVSPIHLFFNVGIGIERTLSPHFIFSSRLEYQAGFLPLYDRYLEYEISDDANVYHAFQTSNGNYLGLNIGLKYQFSSPKKE